MAAQTGFLYCLVIVLLVRRGGPRLSGVVVAAAGQDGMGVGGGRIGRDRTLLDGAGREQNTCSALIRLPAQPRTPNGKDPVFTRRSLKDPQVSGYSDRREWLACKPSAQRLL